MRQKIKWLAWIGGISLLIYTRFVDLSWGLPFPFHPDERNMAVALAQLQCTTILDLRSCFNPHFFAYGQLPLFVGYVLVLISRAITHVQGAIRFDEAVLALRSISFLASLGTVMVMRSMVMYFHMRSRESNHGSTEPHLSVSTQVLLLLIVIFSPGLIQFSHFGTTESLLMLLYTWLVYRCIRLEHPRRSDERSLVWIGMLVGCAIAVKLSSMSFLILPFICVASLSHRSREQSRYEQVWSVLNEWIFIVFVAGVTALSLSPHNRISWSDFLGSMQYESAVAAGAIKVFYTWTFERTVPMLFQVQSIFPYALGLPVLLLSVSGLVFLPRTWRFQVLRLSILVFFVLWSFAYTKWTRFMAPLFPVMITTALLQVMTILESGRLQQMSTTLRTVLYVSVCMIVIYPGARFLQIYHREDVRMTASRWMQRHIPAGTTLLQETANVVDLPLVPHPVTNISFNFYELDQIPDRTRELQQALARADYIIIPSRRIFANYWCRLSDRSSPDARIRERCIMLRTRFPRLNQYYDALFSGRLGYRKVVEFATVNDEAAEETWSVFDHPVIRIYKKI